MKLIVVRHGETFENVNNISMGHIDGTLTPNGIIQSIKLGELFKDEKLDFIYCSDLGRTKDTLKEIIKYHPGVPVVYDPLLRERAKGIFEGLPQTEHNKARTKSGLGKFDFRPVGGESFIDVKIRVEKFINYLLSSHQANETILVVTHGGWKNSFMSYITNMPFSEESLYDFKNTSVTIFELSKDNNHQAKLINCAKHLENYNEKTAGGTGG